VRAGRLPGVNIDGVSAKHYRFTDEKLNFAITRDIKHRMDRDGVGAEEEEIMITELSFSHFKSWKAVEKMRLAPITGLFGANSSGKTSVLQLLLMIKQTVESTDRLQVLDFGNEKSAANLGSFRDVVFLHETPGTLDWTIQWKLPKPLDIKKPEKRDETLFAGNNVSFRVEMRENDRKRLSVGRMAYTFAGHEFTMARKSDGKHAYELSVAPVGDFRFTRAVGRAWDLPAPVKCYGFPNEVNARYQNAGFLSDLQLAFEQLFTGTKYLGPLRDYPKRQYPWSGGEPVDMGLRGERVVEALLAAREADVLLSRGKGKKRETLEQRVAEWLKQLNLVHAFHVEPIAKEGGNIYRVKVRRNPTSPDVLITDVGFGVSQILPALVLCYYAPEGSIIILEQPEIHLHPAVQAGLADVFIDAVKTRGIQIVFESHSEHLLKRLQRRTAERNITPDTTALYFCEMEDGASKLTPLNVDHFGSIHNWPKDFFGDQFGEMAATTKAAIEQQHKSQQK
jgi:predicted ATPase